MANYFTDRSVEYPGRYRLNPTDDSSIFDLVRQEGEIYNAGTPLNAENLNGAMQDVIDQIPTQSAFIAVQGSTTYQEVTDALNEGRAVFAAVSNSYGTVNLYPYTNAGSNIYYFLRVDGSPASPVFKGLTLNNSDTWESVEGGLTPTQTTTGTPSMTTSTGSLVSASIARCGKIRSLNIAVNKSTQTAAGSNVYQGQLTNADDRPATLVNAAGYFGSSAAILQIAASGSVVVRIIGASLAANSTVYCGCSYLVP
jgi:hypothetical protein